MYVHVPTFLPSAYTYLLIDKDIDNMAVQPDEMTIAEQVEQAETLTSEPAKAEELYRAALSRKAGMSLPPEHKSLAVQIPG